MRHVIAALVGAVIALAFITIKFSYRIYNLERQMNRIEMDYQAIATQNEQLCRINEQNLWLMTEGGWNDVVSSGTDN